MSNFSVEGNSRPNMTNNHRGFSTEKTFCGICPGWDLEPLSMEGMACSFVQFVNVT